MEWAYRVRSADDERGGAMGTRGVRWAAIAGVAVVAVATTFGVSEAAWGKTTKTKTPKPTIAGLAASPAIITAAGGSSIVSATVANATSCTFSSTPTFSGLPVTVTCSSGSVSETLYPPLNTSTKKSVKYKIELTVSGSTKSKSKKVKLKVGPGAGGGSS